MWGQKLIIIAVVLVLLAGGLTAVLSQDGDAGVSAGAGVDALTQPKPGAQPRPGSRDYVVPAQVAGAHPAGKVTGQSTVNAQVIEAEAEPDSPSLQWGRAQPAAARIEVEADVDANFELSFLQLAYQQALREDPVLAQELQRQIEALSSGQETEIEPDLSANEYGDRTEESSEPPRDEDFPWCQNRPPLEPEVFRCPCPSDPGYRAYWRQHIDPAIATAAGC